MAIYAFLRGWIHAGRNLTDHVRRILDSVVSEHEQFGMTEESAMQLLACWHFPAQCGPSEDFVHVGASIRIEMLPLFEMQLARIANEVVEVDGNDTYHVTGRVEVTIEGQDENQEWVLSDGHFDTTSRRPYFISP